MIRDTYEVERQLGEGAFAEVYRVRHRFLGRQAMKVFKAVGMTIDEIETRAQQIGRDKPAPAPEGRAYPQTNGWTFWQYRDGETGLLCYVDELRQQYLRQKA